MRNLLGLLHVVFFSVSCVNSQISLSESGPGTVRPGEALTLTCKVTGASLTDSTNMYSVEWIRQPAGKGLEWMGAILYDDRKFYATSVQGRLTITRDTNKGEVYFKLTGMKPEDTCVYYCVREYWGFDYWGKGTLVTVTSVPLSAPSVFPLIPCCGSVDLKHQVTVGCLATGFMPSPVEIEWNRQSKGSSVRTTGPVLSVKDGLYIQSSQLTILASEWKNATYQCNVAHTFSGTKQKKTLQVLPCTQPTVQLLLQPPCANADPYGGVTEPKNSNTTLDLFCRISDFYPEKIQVKWLVNGKADASAIASVSAPLKTIHGTYNADSRLTILEGKWNRGTRYSCIVEHTASNTNTMANISKCTDPCPDSLEVHLISPKFKDLYITRNVNIICLVSNMRTTENLQVIWTRENGNATFTTEDPILHDNGTYSAISTLKICSEDWERGEKFTCSIRNQDLPSPLKKTIYKYNERTSTVPSVYVLPPPLDELHLKEISSVTCYVKNFHPNDVLIKWLENGNEVNADKYENITPVKNNDGTFFTYSRLSVDESKWSSGNVYTCVVGHEALPYYITQQSIDKSSGKPNNVSVSLVMSESLSSCH